MSNIIYDKKFVWSVYIISVLMFATIMISHSIFRKQAKLYEYWEKDCLNDLNEEVEVLRAQMSQLKPGG